jgi:acetyl-CoA C-acetyltransferase
MGLGPVFAVPALAAVGLPFEDMDLVELNEAFAAQVLAVHRKRPFDMERCKIYGGRSRSGTQVAPQGRKFAPRWCTPSRISLHCLWTRIREAE